MFLKNFFEPLPETLNELPTMGTMMPHNPLILTTFRYMLHKLIFYIMTLSVFGNASAQVAGDEDKEMINKGKARDQQAIDEAVNGWWSASQKTLDKRIQ